MGKSILLHANLLTYIHMYIVRTCHGCGERVGVNGGCHDRRLEVRYEGMLDHHLLHGDARKLSTYIHTNIEDRLLLIVYMRSLCMCMYLQDVP